VPGSSFGGFVLPSEDGCELYILDNTGRHWGTVNALIGATAREFVYDSDGLLIQIEDDYGKARLVPEKKAAPYEKRCFLTGEISFPDFAQPPLPQLPVRSIHTSPHPPKTPLYSTRPCQRTSFSSRRGSSVAVIFP